MNRSRRRPPPRHARPCALTPARWVLPTGVALVAAVVGLLAWAAAPGAGSRATAFAAAAPHGRSPQSAAIAEPQILAAAGAAGLAPKTLLVTFGPATLSASASAARSAVSDATEASALTVDGIPVTALRAYQHAATREHGLDPACGLTWPLLAGIGRVESDHGRFAGAVLHADGLSTPPVIGIPLNGHGTALIRDTDHGRLDGDTVYDRAVGPMQFIPSTWASWGVDADGDGTANPFDLNDAAAAAADYLCAAGGNLTTVAGQVSAIRSYNDSAAYIRLVMAVEQDYASGAGVVVPVAPGHGVSGPGSGPTLPPVDPGPPRGLRHHRQHRQHRHRPSRSPSSSVPPTTPSTSPSGSPSSSAPSSPTSSSAPSSPTSTAPGSSSSAPPSSTPPSSGSSSSASSSDSGSPATT